MGTSMKRVFGLCFSNFYKSTLLLGVVGLASAIAPSTWATDTAPHCLDRNGKELPIDNSGVLTLKTSTPNQYTTQEHVKGTISVIYPDRNGHHHFAIQIGSDAEQGIEVVFNDEFGSVPGLTVGMTVEACGEYITSNQATAQYPPSPMDAIIHWVHINPNGSGHPSGFLMIDGKLYGDAPGGGSSSHGNSGVRNGNGQNQNQNQNQNHGSSHGSHGH